MKNARISLAMVLLAIGGFAQAAVDAGGAASIWLQLEPGSADIGIIPGKALLVPMLYSGELRADPLPK